MDTRTAQRLANAEMHHYGLIAAGWTFKWDRALARNGQCDYTHKTISLSRPLTERRDEAAVRMTILHEIAHALTPGHGHGYVWKSKFIQMGGDGARCSSDLTREDRQAMALYRIECSITGKYLAGANRKGKRLARSVCRCHGAELTWITQR